MADKCYTRNEMEAAVDIAIQAQHMRETGEIEIEDSRELVSAVIADAERFEQENKEIDYNLTGDYIDRIDNFSQNRLFERYAQRRMFGQFD